MRLLKLLIFLSMTGMISADSSEDLLEAAKAGDALRTYEALQAGANVNKKDGEGFTALMYASQNGHTNVVQHLLAAKTDIEIKNRDGYTAKQLAEQAGHVEVVRLLREAEPKPKTAINDKSTQAAKSIEPKTEEANRDAVEEDESNATDDRETAQKRAETAEAKAELAASKKFRDAQEAWQRDSQTILKLIGKCRRFRESSEMSEVQKENNVKQLTAELQRVNEQIVRTPIYLEKARITEVKKHKVISAHGKTRMKTFLKELKKTEQGRMALKMAGPNPTENFLIGMMMMSYMSGCKKCYEYTGHYLVEYQIAVPSRSSDEGIYNAYQSGISVRTGISRNDEAENDQLIDVEIIRVTGDAEEAGTLNKKQIVTIKGKILGIEYKGGSYSEKITLIVQ